MVKNLIIVNIFVLHALHCYSAFSQNTRKTTKSLKISNVEMKVEQSLII